MQKVDFVLLDISAQLPIVQAGLDNHDVSALSWFCEQFTPEPDATLAEKVRRTHESVNTLFDTPLTNKPKFYIAIAHSLFSRKTLCTICQKALARGM